MKKIYTFFNIFAVTVLCHATLLSSTTAHAQNCGSVVQNFDVNTNGTAGFTGELGYGTNGTNGYLAKDRVVTSGVYSITTPTYQLSNSATDLGYGFTLAGTQQVSRVVIQVVYISTLNDELTTFFLDEFSPPTYNPSTGKAQICASTPLANLPGFPAGEKYRLRIELTSGGGVGTVGQNISFDDFITNGTAALSPLPVTFIGFEAKRLSGSVLLTWKVAGEENVNHYEVERSIDGRSFVSISSITHSGRDTYTYTDATSSTVYYRIKNVDEDGKFKYSTIVRMANGQSEIVLKAFPQPVQTQLVLQYPNVTGRALIRISTADGKLVRSITPSAGSMQSTVDMSGLQKGLYFIRLDIGEGNMKIIKVVKQ